MYHLWKSRGQNIVRLVVKVILTLKRRIIKNTKLHKAKSGRDLNALRSGSIKGFCNPASRYYFSLNRPIPLQLENLSRSLLVRVAVSRVTCAFPVFNPYLAVNFKTIPHPV